MQLRGPLCAAMANRGSMRPAVAGASFSLWLRCLKQRIPHGQFLIATAFAAVAYDLEADGSERLHAKGMQCAGRKIDNPAQQRWTVFSNFYDDASPASLIAYNHAGAGWKRLVRSLNASSFRCIGGGVTAFSGRLSAAGAPCCCKQHTRMKNYFLHY